MKKFTSILCALAIVLSVSAAPQVQTTVKKVAFNEKSLNFKVAKTAQKAAKVAPFQSIGKKAVINASKAPKAKKDVIDLIFSSVVEGEVDWDDNCATSGWWQVQCENDDYYLSLSNLGGRSEAAGEYAWADMDEEFTVLYDVALGDYLTLTDGSFIVAVDEDGNISITGSLTADNGNTYNISILIAAPEPVVIPEGGDFELTTLVSETFYSSDNDVYVVLADADENRFRFDIVVAEGQEALELGHEYTLDDMLANYSYATFSGEKISYTSATFVKTLNDNGSGDMNASFVDADGHTWNLHYAIPEPAKAENFETITAEVTYTSEVVWFWTQYTFTAIGEDNTIEFSIMPDDSFYGTWAVGGDSGIEGTVTPAGGEAVNFYSGEIVITQTEEGFTVTGTVLCDNNTEYTLNLTYVTPDASRQVELTLSGLELGLYSGAWQLSGFNEDSTQYVSIAAYSDEVSGTYSAADLAADYCEIYTDLVWSADGKVSSATVFNMLEANLTVVYNEEDKTISITGTLKGQNADDATDVPEFTLNLTGGAEVIEPTITDVTVSYYTKTFYEEDNDVYFVLYNEDETNAFRFDIPVPAGEKDIQNDHEYTLADMLANYSWLGPNSSNSVSYQSASFTRHISEKGAVSITATILDENGSTWNLNYNEPEPEEALEETLTIEGLDLNQGDGYWQIMGYSADENYYVSLAALTNTVAGSYTIDDLATAYCYIVKDASSDNYVFYDVREANLTVTFENGVLHAVGTVLTANRNDLTKQIKFTIDFASKEPTAVDNVEAANAASKRIENNMLIIEKSGVRYNVLGTVVK